MTVSKWNTEMWIVNRRENMALVHQQIQCVAVIGRWGEKLWCNVAVTYLILRASSPLAAMAFAMAETWMPSSWGGCEMMKLMIARWSGGKCPNWSGKPIDLLCAEYADIFCPALGWEARLGFEGCLCLHWSMKCVKTQARQQRTCPRSIISVTAMASKIWK